MKRLISFSLCIALALSLVHFASGANELYKVTATFDKPFIRIGGENTTISAFGYDDLNTSLDLSSASIAYTNLTPELCSISEAGVLTSLTSLGRAEAIVSVTLSGVTVASQIAIGIVGPNLMSDKDPSFESRSLSPNWTVSTSSAKSFATLDTNVGRTGTVSGTLGVVPGSVGTGSEQRANLYQNTNYAVSVDCNKIYELSAYFKAEGLSSNNKLSLDLYSLNTTSSSSYINNSATSTVFSKNTSNWELVRVPIYGPMPNTVNYMYIRNVMSPSGNITGTFWMDDFSIHEVSLGYIELSGVQPTKFLENSTFDIGLKLYASTGNPFSKTKNPDGTYAYCTEYTTQPEGIVSVGADGIVTALHAGTATITATSTVAGVSKTAQTTVTVSPNPLIDIYLDSTPDVAFSNNETGAVVFKGIKQNGDIENITPQTITFVSNSPLVSIDQSGNFTTNQEGSGYATITATFEYDTKSYTKELNIFVNTTKTGSSFYTEEKITNARANVNNPFQEYTSFRSLKSSAVSNANLYAYAIGTLPEDQVVMNRLWNMVMSEGVPRGITIGSANDLSAYRCPKCNGDIRAVYGSYAWNLDPVNKPFKIICPFPECSFEFPTNDFAGFWNHCLDDRGMFSETLAAAARQDPQIIADHLTNQSGYGDSTWMVDDGNGWNSGQAGIDGKPIIKAPVAFYHHSLWYSTGRKNSAYLFNALNSLRDAYIYTGDLKYGIAGAILIDRVADVYPEYDMSRYSPRVLYNSDGGSGRGKILGCIWEASSLASNLALAYDAFYPVMDNPEVLSFLAYKKSQYSGLQYKSSGAEIRQHGADGILREIYTDVKNGNIAGNFGMHQRALATAAVVLDTMPETKEMIDYLLRYDAVSGRNHTGGSVAYTLDEIIDRDGFGAEGSYGYNNSWMTNLVGVAEALNGYTKYPAANLWEHPKMQKMIYAAFPLFFAGRYTMNNGDAGKCAIGGVSGNLETLVLAYSRLGKPDILAQLAYHDAKARGASSYNYDVFTANAGDATSEINSVISRVGELKRTSSMQPSFGLTVLHKDGQYKQAATSTMYDTTHTYAIYYGRTAGHGHPDTLNLDLFGYGLSLTPDMAYPESTGAEPNRPQWVDNTISHNTVIVNEKTQSNIINAKPLHFDDTDYVKVFDVSSPSSYPSDTTAYRRSTLQIKANDKDSYGVDFFRVIGGSSQIYTFNVHGNIEPTANGLDFAFQPDGTYAGPSVPYGDGPANGFSWMYDVYQDTSVGGQFSINYPIVNFLNYSGIPSNLNLRFTMLPSTSLSDVSTVTCKPPQVAGNVGPIKKFLARRTGTNLATLFSGVYEPYITGKEYIQSIEPVSMTVTSGSLGANDANYAIKVTLVDGRVDYIAYATNNTLTYLVDNTYEFRGFVGVLSLRGGKVENAYVNDGDKFEVLLQDKTKYTGSIIDFTGGLTTQSKITISNQQNIDLNKIIGNFIYIENGDPVYNAVYPIKNATISGDSIILDVGNNTTIKSLVFKTNPLGGYNYYFKAGDSYTIPLASSILESTYVAAFGNILSPCKKPVNVKFTNLSDNTVYESSGTIANGKFEFNLDGLLRSASYKVEISSTSHLPHIINNFRPEGAIIDFNSTLIPGETSGDNVINILDLTKIILRYGGADPVTDINGDGVVNTTDISITVSNIGYRATIE